MAGTSCVRSVHARIELFHGYCRRRWILLGYFGQSMLWYIWAALLFGIRFLRIAPIYDPLELDPPRRFGACLAFLVFVLSFMPMPILVG